MTEFTVRYGATGKMVSTCKTCGLSFTDDGWTKHSHDPDPPKVQEKAKEEEPRRINWREFL